MVVGWLLAVGCWLLVVVMLLVVEVFVVVINDCFDKQLRFVHWPDSSRSLLPRHSFQLSAFDYSL